MKIKRLELKAFGPFSGEVLDFSSSIPGLHIVYGTNEAGKSSAMRALHAWFFGFPVRTGDNFIHQSPQLLVGGCLQGSDGRELTFFRRKRNLKDLFDQHDNPLEPSALSPWLHGVEKELFTALYGINHETLIQGGQGILDQKGEVGKALFAAGAGLASLKPIMDELEEEGEQLFRPQGSSRFLNEAIARHKELQTQFKQATLSGREWEEHRQALDEALKKLAENQRIRQKREREKRRLERLMQALPDLSDRTNLLEKLAELGEVMLLPPDFTERRMSLEQKESAACLQNEQIKARLQALRKKMAQHSLNEDLLNEVDAIEELHQRLGEYRKGKSDRPLREGQRISARKAAAELLRQIKPELSLNDIETLRPGLSKRKTVQYLGSRYEAIVQGGHNARQQLQEVEKLLENAGSEVKQLSPVSDPGLLTRALLAAERAADLDKEIMSLEQEREKGEHECRAALNRLGLWSGPLEQVLHLALPLPETVNRFDEEFRALIDEERQLKAQRETLEQDHAKVVERLHHLEFASDVPAEQELARSRSRREQGWHLLRRQWIKQEDVAAESRNYDAERPLPEAYENMVSISDHIADRLYREADRVQQYASLKAEAGKIEKRLAVLHDKESSVNGALAGLTRHWQEQWQTCGFLPLSPREMSAWLISFDHLRILVRESEKRAEELAEKVVRRCALRGNLLKEIVAIGGESAFPGEALDPVLDDARLLLNTMQTLQKAHDSMDARIRNLSTALETSRNNMLKAEDELQQWRADWRETVSPLGLEGTVLPPEALDILDTLQACFERLKEADEFRKRIEGIDRDIKVFEEDVERLVQKITPDLAGIDAHPAVTELKLRLGRAIQEQTIVRRESEELENLEKELLTTETNVRSCEEQLAAMLHSARCNTKEELLEAEQRSTCCTMLKNRLLEMETRLTRIAEGTPLSTLEAQAKEADPDELPGLVDTLNNEIINLLDPEIQQLSEIIGRKRNELERMDGSGKAAELADALQHSLTKIRRMTDRYIRIKLAEKILRDETERYRNENEAPVLKIASRYFTELTMGSFSGLRTDSDDHGKLVLIGLRPNGIRLQVDAMSSGTRDQLYLSLRLATLEWRTAASSEPMPFIVDDILINFDDKRSRATIAALAELGEKSQVILFTHHHRIVDVAMETEFVARVFVHQLKDGTEAKGVSRADHFFEARRK